MLKKLLLISLLMGLLFSSVGCSKQQKTQLEITAQPKFIEIEAPNKYTCTVEVNEPSLVKSYQWQIFNEFIYDEDSNIIGEDWHDLTGSSANTDTLVRPSTNNNYREGVFRCVITDKNGNEIVSEAGGYTVSNGKEPIGYIQLGEVAVKAGETLDLSTTPFGSGTISLNAEGNHAIMNNVHYDNTNAIFDIKECDPGFSFCDFNTPVDIFTLEVQGECTINNTLWIENYATAGLAVVFNHYGEDSQFEKAVITGDGSLYIKGGQSLIYCDENIEIDCDLIFDSFSDHFTQGVKARGNVSIHDCSITSDNLNGRIISSEYGYTVIDNCKIDTKIQVPHVMVGVSEYRAILGYEGLEIYDSEIKADAVVYGDWHPNGLGCIIGLTTDGEAIIENSTIELNFKEEGENENLFNLNFLTASSGLTMENSKISLNGDCAIVNGATGVYGENMNLKNSTIELGVNASGTVYGIAASGEVVLDQSTINIKTENAKCSEFVENFGMMTYGIKLLGAKSLVQIDTEDGIALGIFAGVGENEVQYDESYKPLYIPGSCRIASPANAKVNVASLINSDGFTYIETIYQPDNYTLPAPAVSLTAK